MLNAQPPAAQLVSFKICGMIIDAFGPVTTMHRFDADPTSVLPEHSHFKRHFASTESHLQKRR